MDLFEFMKKITYEAGENIRKKLNEPLNIEEKTNPNDLVTNMDKETEQFLYDKIMSSYPDHQIIGEEGHGHHLKSLDGIVWIIDPIDGTLNFIHQQENFAISIGVYKDNEKYAGIVYDVMRDIMYSAKAGHGAYKNEVKIEPLKDTELSRSIISMNPNWLSKSLTYPIYKDIIQDSRSARSYGSAALDFAYIATGKIDAYITLRLHPWDFTGGLIIVEEAGGVATNQLNETINPVQASSILVANRSLHKEIMDNYLKTHYDVLKSIHRK